MAFSSEVWTGARGYATVSLPRDFLDEIEMELDAARRNPTRLALAVNQTSAAP